MDEYYDLQATLDAGASPMVHRAFYALRAVSIICIIGCLGSDGTEDVDQLLAKARNHRDLGDCQQARNCVDSILSRRLTATKPELTVECAMLLHDCGESKQAIEVIQACVNANKGFTPAVVALGDVWLEINEPKKALEQYGKAVAHAGPSAELHYRRGLCYEDMGADDDAIRYYTRAIDLDSEFIDARMNRSRLNYQNQQTQEAITDLLAIESSGEDYPVRDVHFRLALAFASMSEFRKGLKHSGIAINASREKQHEILVLRGNIYDQMGQHEMAIENYRLALDLDPNYALVHYNLGITLQELGRHKAAIRRFQQALECGMETVECYRAMGISHFKIKQFDQSRRSFAKALEIDPKEPVSQEYMERLK